MKIRRAQALFVGEAGLNTIRYKKVRGRAPPAGQFDGGQRSKKRYHSMKCPPADPKVQIKYLGIWGINMKIKYLGIWGID